MAFTGFDYTLNEDEAVVGGGFSSNIEQKLVHFMIAEISKAPGCGDEFGLAQLQLVRHLWEHP